MKVLVTGANGYIGRHVVNYLLSKDLEVIAADINYDALPEQVIRTKESILSGDLDIYEKLGKPDRIIHLAWQDGFVHNSDSHICNLPKHYLFLKHVIESGCRNISVMGTMHEVGYWEGKVDENTPCNPLSQYGIAKNALRQSLFQFANGKDINIFWLRAYYILGDDTRNHSIFTKLLQAAKEGKDSFPFTSGKTRYDFIDVDDLAHKIVDASLQDKYTGIINVCSGKPVTLAEKVEEFIRDRGLNIKLKYGAFPDRPYDSPIIYGDSTIIDEIQGKKK